MANGDDVVAGQPAEPDMGGGGAPQGPPQMGGGPVLAALARNRSGPQVSAPGMGNIAQGLMQMKSAVDMLAATLNMLPTGGQQYKDVLKALQSLSRHLPQGAPVAGVQQTQLGDLLRNTVRNALMQKLMTQQQGGGQQGGAQPGGMPAPPTPSTPLPGA